MTNITAGAQLVVIRQAITNEFYQWGSKPSVKGALEPAVMNFL
jgi:hypothetical protein